MTTQVRRISADACVVGGGPAGLMLGLLLARAGVRTVVLEKHADFLRDFRGDTVHPSTITLLDRLGLAEKFLELPHQKVDRLQVEANGRAYTIGDFSRLHVRHPYVAVLPQWDFLDFLAGEAAGYPEFTLLRSTRVTGLLRDSGVVRGVRAEHADGPVEVTAALTVACDGRHSDVRRLLGLTTLDFGAPMDVLWFRLPRNDGESNGLVLRLGSGRVMATIDRGHYFQIAYVIPKGAYQQVVDEGLPAFRQSVAGLVPLLADRVDRLTSWDQVSTLTVQVNRLRRWHAPGVLLIGDAAHAMSPVGGVGVNLAIQDAVATARLVAGPLRTGRLTTATLGKVRRRRWLPTAGTQLLQRAVQARVLGEALASRGPVTAPLPIRLIDRLPRLRVLPAFLVGIGVRPEYRVPPPASPRPANVPDRS